MDNPENFHPCICLVTVEACMHVQLSSEERGLNFRLSLYLHLYFVYASSKGSGKTAQRRQCKRCKKSHADSNIVK